MRVCVCGHLAADKVCVETRQRKTVSVKAIDTLQLPSQPMNSSSSGSIKCFQDKMRQVEKSTTQKYVHMALNLLSIISAFFSLLLCRLNEASILQ